MCMKILLMCCVLAIAIRTFPDGNSAGMDSADDGPGSPEAGLRAAQRGSPETRSRGCARFAVLAGCG